jgi:hypothetical protein
MFHKSLNIIADSLELLVNDLTGVKRSRRYTRSYRTYKKRTRKQSSRLVLNERAQLRLAGKLHRVLPRDVAISVLNDVNRYSVKA